MSKGTAPTEGPGTQSRGSEKKFRSGRKNLLTNRPRCATILTKGEANTTNAERVDTMTNSKMTYVAALSFVLENCPDLPADVAEKLTALKAQTEKRNSADRKPTKNQIANMALADVVAEVLADAGKPLTITEIMQADERLSGLSNQKVTAVVRGMGDKVVKVPDKRVNRFALA